MKYYWAGTVVYVMDVVRLMENQLFKYTRYILLLPLKQQKYRYILPWFQGDLGVVWYWDNLSNRSKGNYSMYVMNIQAIYQIEINGFAGCSE